ncbi:hypothetical protein CANCADRAFT_139623 [Tortispora caseinolytica NRRL Y-17796]|uniref:MIF4G domain-containing protein n=1 Tax=Tortispora caseinolytica NRRL Y-17796 TaxID=767744 RepID=A0A1E4TCD8_9ASCO|nr:hypothetical protein CANCADRAFT_139623 [Tortispora caseinolytica NRRL Y-17796]
MSRNEKRLELIQANTLAYETKIISNTNVDSSLRKCGVFIRKLRSQLNAANETTILTEIDTLNIERYLHEIIDATVDGIGKYRSADDLFAAVSIVSKLHQRLDGFTYPFILGVYNMLAESASSGSLIESSFKYYLRAFTELWMVAIIRTPAQDFSGIASDSYPVIASTFQYDSNMPSPLEVLRALLRDDTSTCSLLPGVLYFAKSYKKSILGIGVTDSDNSLVTDKQRSNFLTIIKQYNQAVTKHLEDTFSDLISKNSDLRNLFIRKGRIDTSAQNSFDYQINKFLTTLGLGEQMALLLNEKPFYPDQNLIGADEQAKITISRNDEDSAANGEDIMDNTIWEDEDEFEFYHPAPLNVEQAAGPAGGSNDANDMNDHILNIIKADANRPETNIGDTEDPEDTTNVVNAQEIVKNIHGLEKKDMNELMSIILGLKSHLNMLTTDGFAARTCAVRVKKITNHLLPILTDEASHPAHLVKYHARFVALLRMEFPSLLNNVLDFLVRRFITLSYRPLINAFNSRRVWIAAYIAEFVKFGLIPYYAIMYCLKKVVVNLTAGNIISFCTLMEGCGRVLYSRKETGEFVEEMIKTVKRKMAKLPAHIKTAVEYAITSSKPIVREKVYVKERSETYMFLRYLMYQELSKENFSEIITVQRSLDWNSDDTIKALRKVYVKPYRYGDSKISYAARCLSGLKETHPDFVICAIDECIEMFLLGMQQNDSRQRQRRLALAEYFGHLYCVDCLPEKAMHMLIQSCLSFGHAKGIIDPKKDCEMDRRDDHFRLRLLSFLLKPARETLSSNSKEYITLQNIVADLQSLILHYVKCKTPLTREEEYQIGETLKRFGGKLFNDTAVTVEKKEVPFVDSVDYFGRRAKTGGTRRTLFDVSTPPAERSSVLEQMANASKSKASMLGEKGEFSRNIKGVYLRSDDNFAYVDRTSEDLENTDELEEKKALTFDEELEMLMSEGLNLTESPAAEAHRLDVPLVNSTKLIPEATGGVRLLYRGDGKSEVATVEMTTHIGDIFKDVEKRKEAEKAEKEKNLAFIMSYVEELDTSSESDISENGSGRGGDLELEVKRMSDRSMARLRDDIEKYFE